ncbi:MAG: glycosyltransferase family 2 protein [Bacteroidetes bacterium]|nr:glycosyltransferase family 2 protein [Bacteroidota bacterium]
MVKLSIVICVYNEEPNIKPLTDWIFDSLQDIEFELIYVNDGSTDNTVEEIKKINDPRIILIELNKNYGQSSALSAGIEEASGAYIVTMDGDLQNDPNDIPDMLKKAEDEEWDLVAGIRAIRKDDVFLRKIPSKIANFIIRNTTGVKMKDYGCTLKVFRSETAKNLNLYGELHRFIPILAYQDGATITQMNVKHHPRKYGKSKYGIGRTIKVISDLLLILFFKKYMQKPMHLFGNLGVLIFLIGAAIDIYMIVLKILGHDIWGKPLLLLGVFLTLAGIQLITVGIIAELLVRTYYESQRKKPYRIKRITRMGVTVHHNE